MPAQGPAPVHHRIRLAAVDGAPALTLTTFACVPWNAPCYARCGFRVLAEHEWTAGLRAVREREAAHGLDRWPRVCMRRDLARLLPEDEQRSVPGEDPLGGRRP